MPMTEIQKEWVAALVEQGLLDTVWLNGNFTLVTRERVDAEVVKVLEKNKVIIEL